jgi:hypothetical protein
MVVHNDGHADQRAFYHGFGYSPTIAMRIPTGRIPRAFSLIPGWAWLYESYFLLNTSFDGHFFKILMDYTITNDVILAVDFLDCADDILWVFFFYLPVDGYQFGWIG